MIYSFRKLYIDQLNHPKERWPLLRVLPRFLQIWTNQSIWFTNVGTSCGRCSCTVSVCFTWTLLSTYCNSRSSSSPFEAQNQQRWSLFIRLYGSELCCLMYCDNVKLEPSKYPPLPGEKWIIPVPPSPRAPAPTPLHNKLSWKYKYHQHCLSLSTQKPMIHFQLPMPNLPNKLSLCAVYRLEGEREERCLRVIIPLHTHTHTLSTFLNPLLLLNT